MWREMRVWILVIARCIYILLLTEGTSSGRLDSGVAQKMKVVSQGGASSAARSRTLSAIWPRQTHDVRQKFSSPGAERQLGMRLGWMDCDAFAHHVTQRRDVTAPHPECATRWQVVHEALACSGFAQRLQRQQAQPVARALLERVHAAAYVKQVEQLCAAGGGRLDDEDTSVVAASWQSALLAAGAVVGAVEQVLNGTWDRAFCSVRPPGHHALPDRAMGFCIFANAALGAEAALLSGRVQRVAIVDWDAHHGNGTQTCFWGRGEVFVANWYHHGLWPQTGAPHERGVGAGNGTTLNCPLAAGADEAAFVAAWEERIRPALEEFGPELIMISAGFDADRRDPLGGLGLAAGGFATLTQRVVRFAERYAAGRVVSVLEGGYSLAALQEDVPLHVEALL